MILITGATGTIGSEVIKLLTSSGIPVRALVRDPQKAAALQKSGIELAAGSFDQQETLQAALKGIDTAFLLSPSTPDQVHLQNNFVDAAQHSGVRHLVKLSGAGASQDNPQQFARWHWQIEQHIRASGIPFTFIQPIYFMQNFLGKDTAQMIAQQGRFAAPIKADLRFNMVDARDIAAVIASTLSESGHEGHTYVLTGPALLSSDEQAEHFSRLLGKQVTFMEVPVATFRTLLLKAGQPQWLTESVLELFKNLDTFVNDTVANITKKPAHTFDQFISDHIQSFKEFPPQIH